MSVEKNEHQIELQQKLLYVEALTKLEEFLFKNGHEWLIQKHTEEESQQHANAFKSGLNELEHLVCRLKRRKSISLENSLWMLGVAIEEISPGMRRDEIWRGWFENMLSCIVLLKQEFFKEMQRSSNTPQEPASQVNLVDIAYGKIR